VTTILALGAAGSTGHVGDWSRRLVQEADTRGHRLIVVDRPENLLGSAVASNPRHHAVAADFAHADAVRAAVAHLGAPDAVIGFREYSLVAAARLAEEAGVPWNGLAQVVASRAKDTTRETLRSAGLPQPGVCSFGTAGAAREYLRAATLPSIVKPQDAFGSQGVRLVRDDTEIDAAISTAFDFSANILVEDYVVGAEFSVEGIILGGSPHMLDITRKQTTAPPVFVELGHFQPSGLPQEDEDAIHDTVERAVRAVGLSHSLFHVEVWVTAAHEVVCGEVHARLGGDWIHTLIAHRRPGIELFGAVLDDVLGDVPQVPPRMPGRAAAVVGIVSPHAGTVARIHRANPLDHGVVLAEDWSVHVGDVVAGPDDSFGRAGLIVVGADDEPHLDRMVRQVRTEVRVDVAP